MPNIEKIIEQLEADVKFYETCLADKYNNLRNIGKRITEFSAQRNCYDSYDYARHARQESISIMQTETIIMTYSKIIEKLKGKENAKSE